MHIIAIVLYQMFNAQINRKQNTVKNILKTNHFTVNWEDRSFAAAELV